MVPAGTSRRMERGYEDVQDGHPKTRGQCGSDDPRRVDPILQTSRQCTGHGDERNRRNPRGEDIGNQVCIEGDAPVLQVVHQSLRRPFVLECGMEPEATRQNPMWGRPQRPRAQEAQDPTGNPLTSKTDHPPRSNAVLGRFRAEWHSGCQHHQVAIRIGDVGDTLAPGLVFGFHHDAHLTCTHRLDDCVDIIDIHT